VTAATRGRNTSVLTTPHGEVHSTLVWIECIRPMRILSGWVSRCLTALGSIIDALIQQLTILVHFNAERLRQEQGNPDWLWIVVVVIDPVVLR